MRRVLVAIVFAFSTAQSFETGRPKVLHVQQLAQLPRMKGHLNDGPQDEPRFIQFQPLSPSSKEEVARRFNWRPWGRDGEQHPKPVHPTMTLDEGDEARIEDLQLIQFEPLTPSSKEEAKRRLKWRPWGRKSVGKRCESILDDV